MIGNFQCQTTPAGTDVENAAVLSNVQLTDQMALLGILRLLQTCRCVFEICARVLPVDVEEEFIQPTVEVVVMRYVLPRPGRKISRAKDTKARADRIYNPGHKRKPSILRLPQISATNRRAPLPDDKSGVHIELPSWRSASVKNSHCARLSKNSTLTFALFHRRTSLSGRPRRSRQGCHA